MVAIAGGILLAILILHFLAEIIGIAFSVLGAGVILGVFGGGPTSCLAAFIAFFAILHLSNK
jgi:hypothetical protein